MTLEDGHSHRRDDRALRDNAIMALKTFRPTTPGLPPPRAGRPQSRCGRASRSRRSSRARPRPAGATTTAASRRATSAAAKAGLSQVDFRRRKYDVAGNGRAAGIRSATAPRSSRSSSTRTARWPTSWRRSGWGSAIGRLGSEGRREAGQRHAALVRCRSARSCTTSR